MSRELPISRLAVLTCSIIGGDRDHSRLRMTGLKRGACCTHQRSRTDALKFQKLRSDAPGGKQRSTAIATQKAGMAMMTGSSERLRRRTGESHRPSFMMRLGVRHEMA
jgi:hypothetical protein